MKSQLKLVASLFIVSTGLLVSAMALADSGQGQQNQTSQTSQTSQCDQAQTGQTSQTAQQDQVAQQDDSDKNICYIIGEDYWKCARASRYCFWDTEDGRCEPLNDTSFCGRLGEWNCRQQQSCFWDTEDGRCETIN